MTNKIVILDLDKLTIENKDYRRVIQTTPGQQIVLQSIKPGDDIDFEIHPKNDQFIKVVQGIATTYSGPNKEYKNSIPSGSSVSIPPNTWHQIVNESNTNLQIYTIYSPSDHPPNLVQKNHKKQIGFRKTVLI